MSTKEIQQEIECWAFRPTWFTSHAIDTQALGQAISNLQGLKYTPNEEELTEAIYGLVKDLPAILGTPKDIRKAAQEFAAKIYSEL